MPADGDDEAWCDDVIGEDSDSDGRIDNRMIVRTGLPGVLGYAFAKPNLAVTARHDDIATVGTS